MGAKKKSKANKLARMSEEEKMRYLQHRAAVEEEARRRKEQLISTFMKNKLKREEVFSRLNMAKINQQWRQTLRQIKCIELHQDFEDLFKWFDYSSNKKNRIIETLLDDLDEAELQYSRMHHCHTETVNNLIELHGQRNRYFLKLYEKERDEMYEKAKADLKDIIDRYISDEEHLQAALYRMEEAFEEKITSMKSRHVSKIDEIRNNMLTELENYKNAKELQMEKIWIDLETVLKQYWEQTEDRRREYLIMKNADCENCQQIFDNNYQIKSLIETINNLREQLAKVQATNNDRFLECKADKEHAQQLFYSLKKKISDENENDKQKLVLMNTTACKTTEDLGRILNKGKQILQLQFLCRKLETLNEKICPEGFDTSQLTEEEENDIKKKAKEYSEPLAEKVFKKVEKLDGFWKRYNRVLLEKEALALHYQSLQNEEKQLKSLLKSYLSDVVVKRPESKASFAFMVDGENSKRIKITKGVFQDESASPFLFNFYIYDFCKTGVLEASPLSVLRLVDVIFSFGCSLNKAAEKAPSKGNIALTNIISIMAEAKLDSWDASEQLF